EKCLLIELKKEKFNVKTQVPLTVYYESNIVGEFVVDMLIDNKIILELKSVRKLAKNHEIQLVNYLVATRKDIGILLNFAEKKVEIKRKYRILTNAA
ncbi:MAG: GxxExxY protein, partial [Calditrichia bacterium]|nr:GxxExxY protein [Calditrichia bacterium]